MATVSPWYAAVRHGAPGGNINCKLRLTVNVILVALRDALSENLLFL